ncbi:MAG TPA: Mov34/MPN/PAD-1 family protein [Ktedonobacteraceae bacterium]|nr:Mov34/MPN/PAD-1 family protein [Ktedonobacteraceae bacterium]
MQKQADTLVRMSARAKKTLLLDVYKRRRIEACGVLIGTIDEAGNWLIELAHPMRNPFDSPVYFEFDPEDLLNVDLLYPGKVIGAYHSHPTGFAKASGTDRKNMKRVNVDQRIPWVWLIACGPFDQSFALFEEEHHHKSISPASSIIAYHHYAHGGLRQIDLQFDDEK